jgi:cold shock CspA family protein
MTGRLHFYDPPTAWGVIVGDDGQLYTVHGHQVPGPPLREGERVRFEPIKGPGGLRASGIRRMAAPAGSTAGGGRHL